jgi:hypothetical protein
MNRRQVRWNLAAKHGQWQSRQGTSPRNYGVRRRTSLAAAVQIRRRGLLPQGRLMNAAAAS